MKRTNSIFEPRVTGKSLLMNSWKRIAFHLKATCDIIANISDPKRHNIKVLEAKIAYSNDVMLPIDQIFDILYHKQGRDVVGRRFMEKQSGLRSPQENFSRRRYGFYQRRIRRLVALRSFSIKSLNRILKH
jgi:hypothetical protein